MYVTVDIGDEAAPFVEGDPDQIYQIFINLLVNAGRYGAPPVGIEIASVDADVTIRVCDHGEGVPPNSSRISSTPSRKRRAALARRAPASASQS